MGELLFRQLREGLALQRYLKTGGYNLNFAFNIQAEQLLSTTLASHVQKLLKDYVVSGCGLTFELAESGLLRLNEASLVCLYRLRMMGCGLSLDSFGTGCSTLLRLCQLPFSEIKLDAQFVRSAINEPQWRTAISSTLVLGEALGIPVVVEGVETQEQQLLLGLGCRHGQGHWYASAMSAEALIQWF
ncbi:EAL domain-containing protein [Pseudomonas sp. Q1]|uniref:EAL domain-containing protein n=1 Tax=Pseudomonas sp. Q1 TaxID=2202823 RepID=UPI001374CB99|nr:EAL domain-containing protein [Pseudomonas sp. Q1]